MESINRTPKDRRHCPRIDTLELKHHIQMKLGPQKSDKYFSLLSNYLSLRLSKPDFDKLCISLLGRENISLHNALLRAIISNACLSNEDPKPTTKERTPICPREQQSATEIFSFGSRPPVEVTSEEGEEVEQAALSPGTYSLTPLVAPLGVCFNPKENRKVSLSASVVNVDTCCNSAELPDTNALRKRLERQLAAEGVIVSTYCANLINSGLGMFLKGLLKPCLNLSCSRKSVSLTDFEAAMQLNPRVLGKDWPVVLEKVRFHGSRDFMDG